MLSPSSRRSFYLCWYDVLQSRSHFGGHRTVSTTGAINKGLRASRQDRQPRKAGEDGGEGEVRRRTRNRDAVRVSGSSFRRFGDNREGRDRDGGRDRGILLGRDRSGGSGFGRFGDLHIGRGRDQGRDKVRGSGFRTFDNKDDGRYGSRGRDGSKSRPPDLRGPMLHESHSKRDEAQQKEPHHEGPSLLAAVYQQIRSLAAMVKDQRLKSGPEPEVFSSSARELVKSINAAVRDLDSAGQDRTKVVAYLLGHLKAMDAYVREAEGEAGNVQVAQKTMIKELGGWGGRGTFVLVLQGERVKAESPMEAWRRPVAATSERDAVTSILARDLQRAALGSEFNPEKLADPSDSLQDVDEPDHIRQRGGKKDYDRNGGIPLSVPYTTAASQFLYGTNVVWAALRARKRKLHHLYISRGAQGRASSNRRILNLALASHIPVDRNPHIKLLDKMSGDRPHNGVVLETSALPAPSTLYLRTPKRGNLDIPLGLVDGSGSVLEKSQSSWRQPFVIMLDGILDPVNLGSILRTAHFYGVDAVAIATNTCAPLSSAVLARASSGACEGVPLLSLPHPSTFIFRSAKAGWRTYASVTPTMSGTEGAAAAGRLRFTASLGARSPLADAPVILMLGAEGEGLRTNLFRQAHSLVSIEGGSNDLDIGLDSLNVGVATGVLLEAFLRKPLA